MRASTDLRRRPQLPAVLRTLVGMPPRRPLALHLPWLLASQDQLITRAQAYDAGMTKHGVANCVARHGWHEVLPDVFLTHAGELNRRQMMLAALLWAGPDAAIDARDACRFHGIKAVALDEQTVDVVVPAESGMRSKRFVRIRRSAAPIDVVRTAQLRYVDAATAVVAATRRMTASRAVLAALSDALQRRTCTELDLVRAHIQSSRKNALLTDQALAALCPGARSVGEVSFKDLAGASPVLPPLLYNCLLRLPDGRRISPDALCVDAALVHETNGGSAHRREDLFEDMQERHQIMTVAGFTALHSTPHQLWTKGRRIIAGFETCYLRLKGRGLPPGVVIVEYGPASASRAG